MEEYRLPSSLVGMLKATRLTGNHRVQTDLQSTTLAVTITWDLATSTTAKKKTKTPASKTAPATKKKKPALRMAKSSTPPKPPKATPQSTPPTSPLRPTPASPRQPTPPPKKAAQLRETIQRITKVATRRLARQGGLTSEPATQQPSTSCPEVLSPQVTARRVGPPPTDVLPPSPMQLDKSANSSTSSRIDTSGKIIDTHPSAPDVMENPHVNVRIRCMQRFREKGWKHRKIWFNLDNKAYYIMLTRPSREHCVITYRPVANFATVYKGPDARQLPHQHQPTQRIQPKRMQKISTYQPRGYHQRLSQHATLPRLSSRKPLDNASTNHRPELL